MVRSNTAALGQCLHLTIFTDAAFVNAAPPPLPVGDEIAQPTAMTGKDKQLDQPNGRERGSSPGFGRPRSPRRSDRE